MRKVVVLEVILIIVTLLISLFSYIFWINNQIVVTKEDQILQTSQLELLFWDLKDNQIVTCSFNYSGGNGTTGFEIDDPNNSSILNSVTVSHHGEFTFRAGIDGFYTLFIKNYEMQNNHLDYHYVVSSSIFGFDLIPFIGLVLIIGIILAVAVITMDKYLFKTRKKTNLKTQNVNPS